MNENAHELPRVSACQHRAYMVVEPTRWRIRAGAWSSEPIESRPGVWCLDCGQLLGSEPEAMSHAERMALLNEQRLERRRAKWRENAKQRYYAKKEQQ